MVLAITKKWYWLLIGILGMLITGLSSGEITRQDSGSQTSRGEHKVTLPQEADDGAGGIGIGIKVRGATPVQENRNSESVRESNKGGCVPKSFKTVEVEGYAGKRYVTGEVEISSGDGQVNGYILNRATHKDTYIYGKLESDRKILAYDVKGNVYQLSILSVC